MDSENRLYDPDPMSILTLIVGAIGSLGGIYAFVEFHSETTEKKKLAKNKKQEQQLVKQEIESALNRIESTCGRISMRLFQIREMALYGNSKNSNLQGQLGFGKHTITLKRDNFYFYIQHQNEVIRELEGFINEVSALEEYLSLHVEWCSSYEALLFKNQLKKVINDANGFLDGHQRKTINSFFREVEDLIFGVSQLSGAKIIELDQDDSPK